MSTTSITFDSNGVQLAAVLEKPLQSAPVATAIFAHCFTCNKNLGAVKNITRGLTAQGIAVLRFDFTGLGQSEGDFGSTSFQSNVADLVAAAIYLRSIGTPPSLLVGHSLGGAAVIFAANEITEIQAVATIGAPSDPKHVTHLFKGSLEAIIEQGKAEVSIGGRPFEIGAAFVQDLYTRDMAAEVKGLRKPLLIFHSPQDTVVGIENAQNLYQAAHHPKSFISLDGADHLLSSKSDSVYVGETIAAWVKRYVAIEQKAVLRTSREVAVRTGSTSYTTQIAAGHHLLVADEPLDVGGDDFGPTPYGLVTAGLGACTSITLQMYAKRKGWPLDHVEVHLSHAKDHNSDCEDCEDTTEKVDVFQREIVLVGPLSEEQREKLLQIASKCPVHKTLEGKAVVETFLRT